MRRGRDRRIFGEELTQSGSYLCKEKWIAKKTGEMAAFEPKEADREALSLLLSAPNKPAVNDLFEMYEH